MTIVFRQSGDPWHDWGLCDLYAAACEAEMHGGLSVSAPSNDGFSISSDLTPEEFGKTMHAVLTRSDRWDLLYPRFEEGKKIDRCYPHTHNGRRVPDEKYDPKVSRDEWEAASCKGNPPVNSRNRCQRLASVTLTQGQVRALMAPAGGAGSFEEIAANAARERATVDITQGANPLVAKHHSNSKVRGPSGTNSALQAPSMSLLPSFCATVSSWKPFVKDDDCVIFLPENLPFVRALRLWNHFNHGGALVHPDAPNGDMYGNLPLRADGDEARLLVLLDSLQDHLAFREQELFSDEITLLNDWIAIHFSSGTSVNIGAIYRIEVPGEIFPLLREVPLPGHWNREGTASFVKDCLTGLRVEDTPVQSHIARALFLIHRNPREAWGNLKNVALSLYKNVNRAGMTSRLAAQLLPHFYLHFSRRLLDMTEDQLESCRKIGELAGSAFHRDITILSRLHNTSSPGDFRANLELLAFRLFKASNGDDRAGLWNISGEELKTLLDLTHDDRDWQAAAQTISAFASLKAFNMNLSEGRQKP